MTALQRALSKACEKCHFYLILRASAFVRVRQPESSDYSCTWVMRARMTIDNYIVLIVHALVALAMQPVIGSGGRRLGIRPLAMQYIII